MAELPAKVNFKEEIDIGPTTFQPMDIQFMLSDLKTEPDGGDVEHNNNQPRKVGRPCGRTYPDGFTCTVCYRNFPERRRLQIHSVVHTGEKNFVCKTCGKAYTQLAGLRRHSSIHTDTNTHTCDICNKLFKTKRTLASHKVIVHDRYKPYVCNICGNKFKLKSGWRSHQLTHSDDRQFECDHCALRFKEKGQMVKHMKAVHLKMDRVSCNRCGKSCVNKFLLSRHMETHKAVAKRPLYKCDICEKSFLSFGYLTNHKVLHGEKQHRCDICEREFHFKSNLNVHLKIHGVRQKFTCDICKKELVSRKILIDHIRNHVNIIPFVCKVCGKKFHNPKCLQSHRVTHRARLIGCDKCDKKFKSAFAMRFHRRRHEIRYYCDYCNEGFSTKRKLIRHFEVHQINDRKKCKICRKRLKLMYYNKHMVAVHGVHTG